MKKTLVIIIHILAVIAFTAAFSALYIDSTDTSGITWVSSESYEDSPQFAETVNAELERVKRYAFLTDVFGPLEDAYSTRSDSPVIVEAVKDGETVKYTLPMIVKLAESFGDKIDKTTGEITLASDTTPNARYYDVRVTKKAYDPDFLEYVTPGPSQGTMGIRSLCQEVLRSLKEYTELYNRYNDVASNFKFVVYYPSLKEDYVIVSNTDLPPESMANLGKYVIARGQNATVQTNISPSPVNAAYVPLLTGDPELDDYYQLAAGVDTNYPVADSYQTAASQFAGKVNKAYFWIAIGIAAFILTVITLVLILRDASVHAGEDENRHKMDLLPFEIFCLLMAGIGVIVYLGFKVTLCKIIEGLAPYSQENYWKSVFKGLIIYSMLVVVLRSMIRRYRKGVLYKNSIFNRMELAIEKYLDHMRITAAVFTRYLGFAVINVGGTAVAVMLFMTRSENSRRVLVAAVLMVILLIVDALVFNGLFKATRQRENIGQALKDISVGETEVNLNEKEFTGHELKMAKDINHISVGLSTAVRDQVRSERLKADLITNVSHDIKTPLTSIINYVGLLKRESIQNEKALEYIDVLEHKSERLKKLIEDLVEASKASSGNVRIELAKIDLAELTVQAAAEFEDKFAKRGLEFCFEAPEEEVYVKADGRHLWRVFDNLLNNASKYSLEGTRVYSEIVVARPETESEAGYAVFTIKNISAAKLNISPDELTERFVRGDVSRTTEGSGLGLSIAQSLCSLMGGELKIEIDGDLYKANVVLPLYMDEPETQTSEEA